MECGTRQGCSLTPLLFLLSMEPLTLRLQKYRLCKGMVFRVEQQDYDHVLEAFVDNPTLILAQTKMYDLCKIILDEFGGALEPIIQPHKSHGI